MASINLSDTAPAVVLSSSFTRWGNSFSSDLIKPMVNNYVLGIRLYVTVQNAFTFTRYDGLDPEIYGGIDNNIYPRPRIYLFGISARF